MIDPRNYARTEQKLRDCLLKDPGITPWEFEWQKNGKLNAKSAYKTREGSAQFTVIFDPFKSLIAFTLEFNGPSSHRLAEKYRLRDIIDDLLWISLPNDKSLFEFSIT